MNTLQKLCALGLIDSFEIELELAKHLQKDCNLMMQSFNKENCADYKYLFDSAITLFHNCEVRIQLCTNIIQNLREKLEETLEQEKTPGNSEG